MSAYLMCQVQHHLSVHVQLPSWQYQLQLCQNDWHLLLQMLKALLTDALLSEDPADPDTQRLPLAVLHACCRPRGMYPVDQPARGTQERAISTSVV